MNNHTTSITTNKKHHYRELLAIGIPIIIGQLGTIILGFADTLMIGHHRTPELSELLHGSIKSDTESFVSVIVASV